MKRFWESLILPILDRLQPRVVIEIGSDRGETTELLLTYCAEHGATLHAIDPVPHFATNAWQAEFPKTFYFHPAKSLDVLPAIAPADLVLVDGDHNWFTVYHELTQLAEVARAAHHPFPVVLIHDIGWPYGRRDLYSDPQAIPATFRQPYQTSGGWVDESVLQKPGNRPEPAIADNEGGPRNGVLAAVEDFMAECGEAVRLIQIDGFHGLGVLYPAAVGEAHPALQTYLTQLEAGMGMLGAFLRELDEDYTKAVATELEINRHST